MYGEAPAKEQATGTVRSESQQARAASARRRGPGCPFTDRAPIRALVWAPEREMGRAAVRMALRLRRVKPTPQRGRRRRFPRSPFRRSQ